MFIVLLYGAVTLDDQVDVIHSEAVWKLSVSCLSCRQHAPPLRASLVSHPSFDFESYSSSASSEGWRSACPSHRSVIQSNGVPASSREETFFPSRRWKKTTLGITPVKSSLGDLWFGGRLNWPWLVRLCLLWVESARASGCVDSNVHIKWISAATMPDIWRRKRRKQHTRTAQTLQRWAVVVFTAGGCWIWPSGLYCFIELSTFSRPSSAEIFKAVG